MARSKYISSVTRFALKRLQQFPRYFRAWTVPVLKINIDPLSSPGCFYSKLTPCRIYTYICLYFQMHFSLPKMLWIETMAPQPVAVVLVSYLESFQIHVSSCSSAVGQGRSFYIHGNQSSESLGLLQGDLIGTFFHGKYFNEHLLHARFCSYNGHGILMLKKTEVAPPTPPTSSNIHSSGEDRHLLNIYANADFITAVAVPWRYMGWQKAWSRGPSVVPGAWGSFSEEVASEVRTKWCKERSGEHFKQRD